MSHQGTGAEVFVESDELRVYSVFIAEEEVGKDGSLAGT
jgi:hypothetical protein